MEVLHEYKVEHRDALNDRHRSVRDLMVAALLKHAARNPGEGMTLTGLAAACGLTAQGLGVTVTRYPRYFEIDRSRRGYDTQRDIVVRLHPHLIPSTARTH